MKILLGLPDALTDGKSRPSHLATKVGGCPHVPEASSSVCFPNNLCGVCKSPLTLIFQTHVPLSSAVIGKEIKERLLFVFSCLRKGCGKHQSCWRVYRLQMELPNPSPLPQLKNESKPGLFSDGLKSTEGSGFDLEGIRSALEALSKSKKTKKKSTSKRVFCEDQLPEFYLYADAEPESTKTLTPQEDAQVQSALSKYKAQTNNYEESIDPSKNDGLEEGYEKSKFKAMDGGAFWRFQQRLNRSPEQCVRYGFKSEILSPVSQELVKRPPNCENCGSARVFELQLTPHLMNAFVEAAEWIKNEPGSRTPSEVQMLCSNSERFALERDWCTVVIYTCNDSCHSNSTTCLEEVVHVYDEPNRTVHSEFALT